MLARLAAQGVTARAAVADTPGAAHAVARFGKAAATVVPVAAPRAALAPLPIEALRLPRDIADGLRLLGFEHVAQLAATPRAPLTRRFGPLVATRLDQALGTVFEPIVPVFPPELMQARLGFAEPLLTAEAFAAVIARLTATVCAAMEKAGQGARRLDLLFERVDGSIQCLRIGTARPSRDARHLARLLSEKLERVDPRLGVEGMLLMVPLAEPLAYAQASAPLSEAEPADGDVSALVDRLQNRLGVRRVWRAGAVESDVPERSVRRLPALAPWNAPWNARLARRATWPADLPRPVRLLDPPQPVDAMALLPDAPPVAFTCAACAIACGGRTGRSVSQANGGSARARCGRCATISRWRMKWGGASGCSAAATARMRRPAISAGSCTGFFEGRTWRWMKRGDVGLLVWVCVFGDSQISHKEAGDKTSLHKEESCSEDEAMQTVFQEFGVEIYQQAILYPPSRR